MDRLSSDELFSNFGISSTPNEKSTINKHIRFNDEENQLESINLATSSSSDSDSEGYDEIDKEVPQDDDSGRGKSSESEKLEINVVQVNGLAGRLDFDSDRINTVLERLGVENAQEMSRGEKIDNLIKNCERLIDENKKLREQSAASVQDLFIMDSLPGSECPKAKYTVHESESASSLNDSSTKTMECFNCGGNHAVADCKEPLDQSRIKRKKMEMMRSKSDRESRNRRYAKEHSKFKPGVMSDDLRNALFIKENELPPWIYKMRKLGYPPGHLKDAFSEPSNMKMMDENGELIKPKSGKDKGSYSFDKIISFAGFNEPMPEGVKDNFAAFGVPPFSNLQARTIFVETLQRELNGNAEPATSTKAGAETFEVARNSPNEDNMEITVEDEITDIITRNNPVGDEQTPQSIETVDEVIEEGEIREKTGNNDVDLGENSEFRKTTASTDSETTTTLDERATTTPDNLQPTTTPNRQPTTLKPSFSAQSLNVELGTPVSVRSAQFLDSDDDDEEKSPATAQNGRTPIAGDQKPSLEAFSVGVNKFEYLEETLPCRGAGLASLKKILDKKRK